MSHDEGGAYILGHSNEERRRLMMQSRFFGELTEIVLARAGLAEGMNFPAMPLISRSRVNRLKQRERR